MSYGEIYLPKSDLDEYHVNREFYQPIDALNIKITSPKKLIMTTMNYLFQKEQNTNLNWERKRDPITGRWMK